MEQKESKALLMVMVDKKLGKYAHPEVERKFLLAAIPPGSIFSADITDHYIPHTTLRLRKMQAEHEVTFKLGQKIRVDPHGTRVILHTSLYLSETEYTLLASALPAQRLGKRRFKFHWITLPMAIDQFQGPLEGLILAEVDFGPHGDPSALSVLPFALAEVTDDERFTGGRLAVTTRPQVEALLNEFNVK